ncbi:YcjF family protein [Nannocystis radixulma]|uniref:DUF697 domain-containing protein n=1 Tax=Nannocystis radixulma TaxID=2995305 RepID=A0ABT5BE38_9BACT|nr:DUF697 domain-containing protein [Nannocystis radixulma]MDC0671973.1 DUF697 domain-containing protein [Nannocystis radixulma]
MATQTAQEKQTVTEPKPPAARLADAEAIIHRNVLWSLGAGAVPVPVADVVAVVGVQLKLLKELSDLYEVKFTEGIARKSILTLLSSLGGIGLGVALGGSIAKLIPAVGTALGIVTVPIIAGAFTHATGRIFLLHFEAGGTVLNFDAKAMREHFRREFESAKEKVAQLHDKVGNKV